RSRGYITMIPWYFYETNMVGTAVIRPTSPLEHDDGRDDADDDNSSTAKGKDGHPNAESSYFLGMLDLLRPFFPKLQRVRAAGGYSAFKHHLYGKVWGIGMSLKFREDFVPGSGSTPGAARKAASEAYLRMKGDEAGFWKDYHMRSQQEGCQFG